MNNAAWFSIENKEHADMDDTSDWSEGHPMTQRAHRALPRCTGICDSGRRDCSCPTGQPQPAEACTEMGADARDDFNNADRVFWIYAISGLAIWCVVITVWLAAS